MADYGYGLWFLVAVNSLVFIIFAASFFHPQSKRDWRALGGFSAFVIALFTEMYGYPLTIYLLTGPLGGLVPGVDAYAQFWLRDNGYAPPNNVALSDAVTFRIEP